MKIEVDKHDLFRAVLLLDASVDALDAAAERERKREAGKFMRQVTEQERAKKVREFVTHMAAEYGIDVS